MRRTTRRPHRGVANMGVDYNTRPVLRNYPICASAYHNAGPHHAFSDAFAPRNHEALSLVEADEPRSKFPCDFALHFQTTMKPWVAVPATLALVYRAWSRNSLTLPGIAVAALTAVAHAVHPWSVFFTLLVIFFLAGTTVTKVCGSLHFVKHESGLKRASIGQA